MIAAAPGNPGTGVKVFLACGVTDMRKGIGGLSAVARRRWRSWFSSRTRVRARCSRSEVGAATGSSCCTGTGKGSVYTTRCWRRVAFRGRHRRTARFI